MRRELWKKYLSYLRPQVKLFDSEVNEQLLVQWIKGKKVLDTMNTNYSYGGLEDVLNKGLDHIPLEEVKSVLVLGMGGGCVVDSLRNRYDYHGPITGIELDPVVIEIAKNEFGLYKDKKLKIVEADAEEYVAQASRTFDLVIIDLFIDLKVPEQFYSKSFWKNVESCVNDNGFVLFNAGINLDREEIKEFLNRIPQSFAYHVRPKLLLSNTVINLHKKYL